MTEFQQRMWQLAERKDWSGAFPRFFWAALLRHYDRKAGYDLEYDKPLPLRERFHRMWLRFCWWRLEREYPHWRYDVCSVAFSDWLAKQNDVELTRLCSSVRIKDAREVLRRYYTP